jgi:GMC oxidoreductase
VGQPQRLASSLKAEYDVIICGAGTSGSVLARRSAENPSVNVLLLGAGGRDDVAAVTDPALWPTNLGSITPQITTADTMAPCVIIAETCRGVPPGATRAVVTPRDCLMRRGSAARHPRGRDGQEDQLARLGLAPNAGPAEGQAPQLLSRHAFTPSRSARGLRPLRDPATPDDVDA